MQTISTTPNIADDVMIVMMIIGLSMTLIVPLVNTLLLWLSTKILRFKNSSFLKSLYCILISLGAFMMTSTIISLITGYQMEKYAISLSLLTMAAALIAEVIAVKKLFKVSVLKAVGATLISIFFGFILLIAFGLILGFLITSYFPQYFNVAS